MQTFDSLMERELVKIVNKKIEALKDQLSVNTYDTVGQFKYVMGQIAGLQQIGEMLQEAKELADQSNR